MKHISLYAEGVGELSFAGRHAVVSALDAAYPEIKRVSVDTFGKSFTQSVGVGSGKLTLEGYFIDGKALAGNAAAGDRESLAGNTAAAGDGAAFAPSGASNPPSNASTAPSNAVKRLKALLSAIAAPGRKFTLTVGDRSRELYASSLTYAAEAPFGSPYAEKFKLEAFSDDPYFHGGEKRFAGEPKTQSRLSLPASGGFTLGTQTSTGEVTIINDGDETCGFVLEAAFPAQATEFILSSDREDGRAQLGATIAAGETVIIDTRDGHKSVHIEGGDSLLSSINERCAFFSAPPGKTKLTWRAFSAASPAVTVRLTPGYLNV